MTDLIAILGIAIALTWLCLRVADAVERVREHRVIAERLRREFR